MNGKQRRTRRGFMTVICVTMLLLTTTAFVLAAVHEPSYGVAVVDGDYSEWDLPNDYFADMYKAADPDKDVLSKLYLRYDCSTHTLYALVLVEPGHPVDADIPADNHFVKLGNDTKLVDGTDYPPDGTPPDFAWIGLSTDGTTADGWEASAYLAPATYSNLNAHTDVDDMETSAVTNRAISLTLDCQTAVTLASINASSTSVGSQSMAGLVAVALLAMAAAGGGLVWMHRKDP